MTRHFYCLLQGIVCQEFFDHNYEYQIPGVTPIRIEAIFTSNNQGQNLSMQEKKKLQTLALHCKLRKKTDALKWR